MRARTVGRLAALAFAIGSTWPPAVVAGEASCAADTASLSAVAESLIAADNRRDLEAVLGHYTDSAILLPPAGETVRGKEAIGARYRKLFKENLVEFTVEIAEAHAGSAGWAWLRGETAGTITPLSGGAPERAHATFLMILTCDRDGWKVHRLSWSDGGSEAGTE